jgi:TM2 domain-containing membrane protein YozV
MMYDSLKKNKFIAYLLGALFGTLGIHRLYLKEYVGFVVYITLFFFGIMVDEIFALSVLFYAFDGVYTWFLCDGYNKKVINTIIHTRGSNQPNVVYVQTQTPPTEQS